MSTADLLKTKHQGFGPTLAHEKLAELLWLIGNCRDRPAYLAVRRKSDWQSDLHLAVRHGKSQRTVIICRQREFFSYFQSAENYFKRHGKPVAFYSDTPALAGGARERNASVRHS
jgi:hypothetical protein